MNRAESCHVLYYEGYCKALMDLHGWLIRALPSYKSDRRNNIQHVVWTLEGILEAPDALMNYGEHMPLSMERTKKRTRYYVDFDEKGR